jgi:alpha-ribazole phosphatase/probable phosphoglycerate mutase
MDDIRDSHRIFLIRHGETDWNKVFKYQGITDVPLNEDGLEQARRLGVRLSCVAPDRVLASPLLRARRTAEVIMENNPSDVEIEDRAELREISFGIWEGLTVSEIKKIDGATYTKWHKAPLSCAPKGGEVFSEIFERSRLFVKELVGEDSPGRNTFIVAHGGVLRAVASSLMHFNDIDLFWRMRFDNCSITVIDIWGKVPSMLLSNDTHHLRIGDDTTIASLIFPN